MGNQCCTEGHDGDQELSGFKQNRAPGIINNTETRTLSKGGVDGPDPIDCKKVQEMHTKAPVTLATLKTLEPKINQYRRKNTHTTILTILVSQGNTSGSDAQGPYLFSADNTTYKGQFSNGKKNGMGEQVWPDGSCYQGFFKDGVSSGKGV